MAKKSFSGGLDSLLGGAPSSNNQNEEKKEVPKKEATPAAKVIPQNSSQLNALTDKQKSKIKALAEKEGRTENEIIREAIAFYLDFQVDL
ncbi:CopG family transcriptional regulator [Flammeovirga sp. MY04]|uniref:ribbon-helix-helix domain-containing protein n=1 Tax=Flammeovirga sp. MY04 TaxID=1191459 RepID=UPI0008063AA3|nr:ribbon-helix-helix domain-containing protein [Flammeovirga sp. MY04]ANQ51241.1 CopG family transcriptional regulator [Flammeovirga sp. MY04]